MTAKEVKFGSEARDGMMRGVEILATTVIKHKCQGPKVNILLACLTGWHNSCV